MVNSAASSDRSQVANSEQARAAIATQGTGRTAVNVSGQQEWGSQLEGVFVTPRVSYSETVSNDPCDSHALKENKINQESADDNVNVARHSTKFNETVRSYDPDHKNFESDQMEGSYLNNSFKDFACSFLHWNVKGLASKLFDFDFVTYVERFDFVSLVETFIENFHSTVFKDHTAFVKPALKLTERGRRSGGVVCLIRNSLLPYVKQLHCEHNQVLAFLLDKTFFGFPKDMLYICTYVHPENSPFYISTDSVNGINVLEDCLVDCLLSVVDVYVVLCGDLNSRTSNIVPNHVDDDDFSAHWNTDSVPQKFSARSSKDSVLNAYGKNCLNMCSVLGLTMLNGLCNGDLDGHYTYISETGSSVNDYWLISVEFLEQFENRCTMRVQERIESDHLPLEFTVKMLRTGTQGDCRQDSIQCIEKFLWKPDYEQEFRENMASSATHTRLMYAIEMINVDVNKAKSLFNNILKVQAECMKKKVNVNGNHRNSDWYDFECKEAKKCVRRLLRKYRRSLTLEDKQFYCEARRDYKQLIRRKKKMHDKAVLNELVASVKSQKQFWQSLQKISRKRSQPVNNITMDEWFNHFKKVLDTEMVDEQQDDIFDTDDNEPLLDRPISREEVLLAVRKLKSCKAAGPDDVIGELFKYSGNVVIDFLVQLFNFLFNNGVFPDNWTESILLPLYKKGDINDPNNYRGISLCDISSKLYSSIINSRLIEWIEVNDITGEHQAGFKRNYSTVDHMFTLLAAVQKQFANNRKLYVAFIDFEKAFDSISRKLLWPILMKNGIKGKLFRCVQSMYREVRAKVRCGATFSDYIVCTQGVKQGDACSPVLFSLFINELALEIINNGRHGVNFSQYFIELFILLFADDILLLSETVVGLQTQLNSLHRAATKLELRVNMSKSNIIVFRKGGYLSAREIWYYGGTRVDVVNTYKYLGIHFTTKLSFKFACDDLVSRAKKAVLKIFKSLSKFEDYPADIFFKLFGSQIQPIVQYGSEIWGLEKGIMIEKIQVFFMKKLLGVGWRTPNDFMYGELGRYPIHVNSSVRCIKYWLKVTRMEENRLPYKAYRVMYDLDRRGKWSWASSVRNCLYRYGYGFVWENQGVVDVSWFVRCFKQRLIDCNWQEWDSRVQNSDRFAMYRMFKTTNCMEPYIALKLNRYVKQAFVKFRCGISEIATHSQRYKRPENQNLLCRLCGLSTENEVHFILSCPSLNDLRNDLILPRYCENPSQLQIALLFSSMNEDIIKKLALFLYKALKKLNCLTT